MTDLDKLAARPAAYLSETGVPQLTAGIFFFFLGSAALSQGLLPHNLAGQRTSAWLTIVAILAASGLARCVRVLNRKYVFPRGGYVQMHPAHVSGAIGAIVIVLVLWRLRPEGNVLWPAFALMAAATALVSGISRRHAAPIAYGVYMLGIAAFLRWMPAQGGAWLEVLGGLPLAIYGAFRLRAFVKEHPLSA